MTKQEFWTLCDKWLESPEYKKYEEIAEKITQEQEKLKKEQQEMILAFAEAIGNEYGKQLVKEPEFIKMFSCHW